MPRVDAGMNIVYGVSGEGLGHVFEAGEVAARLRDDGHTVKVLTFGDRACRALAGFQPRRIEGIHLQLGPRGLSLWRTLRQNRRFFPFYLKNGRRLLRELEDFRPEVFLTAYEPFTTLAAHRLRRPLISMDNQNELCHIPRPPDADRFAFHLARWTTRLVTAGAAAYIVKTLERRAPGPGRVHFVAPMVQREIRSLQPTQGSHVLVYLTKPNLPLLEACRSLPEKFIVYCGGRTGEEGNLSHRAPGPGYLRDLAGCRAIIGTTGFSLIADSIYLKKPYLGLPLRGQFEQEYNARFLRRSGLGDYAESVTPRKISEFLSSLPRYRERLAGYDFDPGEQEEKLRELLADLDPGNPARRRPRSQGFAPEAEQREPVRI
jgi:uncharacterized protein (TIGR00661 family)